MRLALKRCKYSAKADVCEVGVAVERLVDVAHGRDAVGAFFEKVQRFRILHEGLLQIQHAADDLQVVFHAVVHLLKQHLLLLQRAANGAVDFLAFGDVVGDAADLALVLTQTHWVEEHLVPPAFAMDGFEGKFKLLRLALHRPQEQPKLTLVGFFVHHPGDVLDERFGRVERQTQSRIRKCS